MIFLPRNFWNRFLTALILAALFVAIFSLCTPWLLLLFLFATFCYLVIQELPALVLFPSASFFLLVFFYLGVPFGMFIQLYLQSATAHLIFLICTFAAVNDTCAYFGGSWWGKRKILSTVSRGKTWEGFLAGLCGVEIFSYLLLRWHESTPPYWYLYAFFIAIIATTSDLFESWLKRRAHLKDSGSLLPGHGGVLDRLDSILGLTIFVWLTQNYLLLW